MRPNFVCAAVFSVFFAAPTGALIINTPSFLTPGPLRLNFTREQSDPIGAFFNIAVSANATRLVDDVDLTVGFVDVKIEMLPGTYFIFAIGNNTDGGSYLGTSPDFLVIDVSSITTASAPSSSSHSSSSARSSPPSGTAVAGQTAPPSTSAVVTSKKSPSIAVIVGVVIGVLVLLAIMILLFFFLRRRKQQRTWRRDSRGTPEAPGPMTQSSGALTSETYPSSRVDPFITPLSSRTSLSSPQQRQQYITNEMRLVRKQMEELRRSGNGTSVSTSVPDSSIISSPTATSRTDASADLERSRQQNDELQSRIVQLEAQLQSAWALGLSNDPPPGYVA